MVLIAGRRLKFARFELGKNGSLARFRTIAAYAASKGYIPHTSSKAEG
jgi:hypothetical protein